MIKLVIGMIVDMYENYQYYFNLFQQFCCTRSAVGKPGCEEKDIGFLVLPFRDIGPTEAPTIPAPVTETPTTAAPTTVVPTTETPTTAAPTTVVPTTEVPTTAAPTTVVPTTVVPTTEAPTTAAPTPVVPTTVAPTTETPITVAPTTVAATNETPAPTTVAPTTQTPITVAPTTVAATNESPAPTTAGAPTNETRSINASSSALHIKLENFKSLSSVAAKYFDLSKLMDGDQIELEGLFTTYQTGYHYLLIANCDANRIDLDVKGEIVVLNPFGYLPAQYYGFLPFYGAMSLFYILLIIIWSVLLYRNGESLLDVQRYITIVIVLSASEMIAWYLDYINFNDVGERRFIAFVFGILSSVIRKTVSRMLVIAVSMGFGVVQAELTTPTKRRIYLFGLLYFIFELGYEIITEKTRSGDFDVQNQYQMLIAFPVAGLDAFCFWWIFVGLATYF